MPLRVVVVSSVVTLLSSATLYDPADADSLACENVSVAPVLTAPTVGRTGMSPPAPQPGPAMWVRLKPVMDEALYSYPPAGREGVSGLHWTMPNGTSAPGKSSAWFDVPMSGFTRVAGEVTSACLP